MGYTLERYHRVRVIIEYYRVLDQPKRLEIFKREFTDDELQEEVAAFENAFRKTLGKKKLKVLEECVIPYLNDPTPPSYEDRFDLSIARCWILQRVFDLGWTVERFGRFDWTVVSWGWGRESRKAERIGKKYQWIAYYEFLARVADNFEFGKNSWSDGAKKYEGSWQIGYVRSIDPSCLLRKTERETWQAHTNTWWFLFCPERSERKRQFNFVKVHRSLTF